MPNRLVPRAEWVEFFQAFSRRHQDWLVTVRVLGSGLRSQIEARDRPLEGIVAGPTASDPISVHLGRRAASRIGHEVRNPRQVWVELSDEGAEKALNIESVDGTKTIVQFRTSPFPLEVDGILQP
jgi:hypothetical protein